MLQSPLTRLSLFFTQILYLLCRSAKETFWVGTEPSCSPPSSEAMLGNPALLKKAEAGAWLSRIQSVRQSPFSLLHTQISHTC